MNCGDVWEALLAVAAAAGGGWPARARVAAVALVADTKAGSPSLGVKLLADLRQVMGADDQLPTERILQAPHDLEESPWGDLRGKPLDARGLSQRLRPYDIKPTTIRTADGTPKGYRRTDFHDAWNRYSQAPSPMARPARSADAARTSAATMTSATSATNETTRSLDRAPA